MISAVVLAALFLFIVYNSFIQEWMGDDILYMYSFVNASADLPIEDIAEGYPPVQSLSDIFHSQNAHYLLLNGRYVAHFLVQTCVALLGQTLFSVLNGLFYLGFIILVLRLVGTTLRNCMATITAVILTLLSFSTIMTPACQIGYIWMFALATLFLLLFLRLRRLTIWSAPALFIFSLIAGNGQEALNIGISCALICHLLMCRGKTAPVQYVMAAGFLLGTLILCISPGSWIKLGYTHAPAGWSLLYALILPRAGFIMAAVVLYARFIRKTAWCEIFTAQRFYWIAWAVCLTLNLWIGLYCNRQLFGAELMAMIIALRLLRNHSFTPSWQIIFGAVAIYVSFLQTSFAQAQRRAFNELYRQYSISPDGDVYVDMPNIPVYLLNFSYTGLGNAIYQQERYGYKMLSRRLRYLYPDRPDIRIFPTALRGHLDSPLGNQTRKIAYGEYIVIEDKRQPRLPKVSCSVNLFGHRFRKRDYQPYIFQPFYENGYYTAYICFDEVIFTDICTVAYD